MNILLTGGASDLAHVLTPLIIGEGGRPLRLDIRTPQDDLGEFVAGSILDRPQLTQLMAQTDIVIHIAAWHGIHEVLGQKDGYDFWDLNATGTFNVFEAAVRSGVKQIIHISTTSIYDEDGYYRQTKLIAEEIATTFAARHDLGLVILRPRAFIPAWNRDVYASFIDWANWFVKGAVHIDDMAQAVMLALAYLKAGRPTPLTADVDGAYEYTAEQLASWDAEGPGTTFAAVYPAYVALAEAAGLQIAVRPDVLPRTPAHEALGYRPRYSLGSLLRELGAMQS